MPQWQAPSDQPAAALQSLLAAINDNDWKTVQRLRTSHPDIPMPGNELMRYAAQACAGKVVFHLQSTGVDPFGPEPESSAFQAVLRSRNYGIAQDMLDYACSINGTLPDLARIFHERAERRGRSVPA
ncbi:MAG: hypothetical protein ABWY05_02870 [Noviherbaspirillum sp.]